MRLIPYHGGESAKDGVGCPRWTGGAFYGVRKGIGRDDEEKAGVRCESRAVSATWPCPPTSACCIVGAYEEGGDER